MSIITLTKSPELRVLLAINVTLSIWFAAIWPPKILLINSELGVKGIFIEPSVPPLQETWVISFAIM